VATYGANQTAPHHTTEHTRSRGDLRHESDRTSPHNRAHPLAWRPAARIRPHLTTQPSTPARVATCGVDRTAPHHAAGLCGGRGGPGGNRMTTGRQPGGIRVGRAGADENGDRHEHGPEPPPRPARCPRTAKCAPPPSPHGGGALTFPVTESASRATRPSKTRPTYGQQIPAVPQDRNPAPETCPTHGQRPSAVPQQGNPSPPNPPHARPADPSRTPGPQSSPGNLPHVRPSRGRRGSSTGATRRAYASVR
jgi:hypothetical protein